MLDGLFCTARDWFKNPGLNNYDTNQYCDWSRHHCYTTCANLANLGADLWGQWHGQLPLFSLGRESVVPRNTRRQTVADFGFLRRSEALWLYNIYMSLSELRNLQYNGRHYSSSFSVYTP